MIMTQIIEQLVEEDEMVVELIGDDAEYDIRRKQAEMIFMSHICQAKAQILKELKR